MLFQNYRHRKHIKKWGSKNKGYFQVFDEKIVAWQDKLIWLLNHPILKYWFRWVLRIHKDCEWNERIDKLLPNSYRIPLGNGKYKQDFRTHNKFSKRLYYAFRPLWWTLHAIDWLVQKTFYPEFSFGFDELTVYPDAGSGYTTVDGYVNYFNASLNTAHNAEEGISLNVIVNQMYMDYTYSTNYYICRCYLTFDTSSIGNMNIDNTIISLYGTGTFNNYDTGQADIYISDVTLNGSNNLVYSDYNKNNFGSYVGYCAYSSFFSNQHNEIELSDVINKTGITEIGARLSGDYNFNTPTSFNRVNILTADASGTSQDPKLVVTYTAASGQQQMMV